MRRSLAVALIAVAGVVAGTLAVLSPAGAASSPSCGVTWGSLEKSDARTSTGALVNVRAGRHTCFDRLVFDLAGPAPGFRVKYVSQVREDGSGRPVPLRGGAFLRVVVRAPAYDADGPTYTPADPANLVNVAGFRTFRQVAWAGSFEGQTTVGLGVRARLPFRVFVQHGPGSGSRVIVDVAHSWQ